MLSLARQIRRRNLPKAGQEAARGAAQRSRRRPIPGRQAEALRLLDVDAFVIVDLPDNAAAAAMALTVNASGAAVTKTTVLMTPEEVDGAVKKSPSYRAPGK